MDEKREIEWVATGDPNVIAASGYPVQIERRPSRGDFVVTGYGRTAPARVFEYAKLVARDWIAEQVSFNEIAGVE